MLNKISKSIVMALATVCISLPFVNTSEAASHKQAPPPPSRHEQVNSDVHFFRGHPPKHHKVCKNPYHARWAPHFHCSKLSHHHEGHKAGHPVPPPVHKPHNNHR